MKTLKRHKKTIMRQLEDTSWLAQAICDTLGAESEENGFSAKWQCLHTLLIIVREADNPDNPEVYYTNNTDYKRDIVICDIKPMYQYGFDYDREGMRRRLSGLAERYKDDDGMYLVHVLLTHDLNSALIDDISGLLWQIRGQK